MSRFNGDLLFLLLAIALHSTACAGKKPEAPVVSEKFNIVLISVDTLRADALSLYGNKVIQTPNIDSIGKSGIYFQNAVSHVPLTLPSHASILTGTLPAKHGIHDNSRFHLNRNVHTMASVAKENGYNTGAFVSSIVLDHRFGLDKGFDHYDDHVLFRSEEEESMEENERSAGLTMDAALDWLSKNLQSRFFLFVHLYDPHARYYPPEPYRSRYENHYLGEVAYVDDQIGRLLQVLQPVRKKTLVVFVSDHGEGLGDHEELSHGIFLYDSTIHVPWIISGPGLSQNQKIVPQVRLIDVMPTILTLAGVSPPSGIDGRSVVPLIQGADWNESEAFAETYYPLAMYWSPLFCLRTSKWKYIDGPEPELYDLSSDPGETKNLVQEQKAIAHQFSKKIQPLKAAAFVQKPQEVTDPELLERLKSLGYLSGSKIPEPQDYSSLPDPKEKLEVWKLYEKSLFLLVENRHEEATRLLETAISIDSSIAAVYDFLARSAFKHEINKSIASLQQAIRLEPANSGYHHRLAVCYRKIGELENSVAEEEIALKIEPDYQPAMIGLGTAYLQMGKFQEALIWFDKTLQKDPKNAAAAQQMGTVYRSMGDLATAEEWYRKAIQWNSNLPDPYNALGVIKAQQRDYGTAENYMKKALQIDPNFEEAYYNLGILYQKTGQISEAIQAFETFIAQADERRYASRIVKAQQWIEKQNVQ